MFAKILAKNKEEAKADETQQKIVKKIAKMNLVEIRTYVNNKLKNFEICPDGLVEVMKKMNSINKNEKRFIEVDAMDSKKKKAFEIIILIAASSKVSIAVSELIQEFIKLYSDIIKKYDIDNKDIYSQKLKIALTQVMATLETMSLMNKKMSVIGS